MRTILGHKIIWGKTPEPCYRWKGHLTLTSLSQGVKWCTSGVWSASSMHEIIHFFFSRESCVIPNPPSFYALAAVMISAGLLKCVICWARFGATAQKAVRWWKRGSLALLPESCLDSGCWWCWGFLEPVGEKCCHDAVGCCCIGSARCKGTNISCSRVKDWGLLAVKTKCFVI